MNPSRSTFGRSVVATLVVAVVLLAALNLIGRFRMPPTEVIPQAAAGEDADFRPTRVVGRQPTIVEPDVVAASDVRAQVTNDELVVGVVIDGQARAYPINMLTGPRREIINDTLGGTPIAATW